VPQILSRRLQGLSASRLDSKLNQIPTKQSSAATSPLGVFGAYASGMPLIQVLVVLIPEQSAVTVPSQAIPLCSSSALPHHDLSVDHSVQLSNHLARARQSEPCVTSPWVAAKTTCLVLKCWRHLA
jgi:hypothetical protein